MSTLPVTHVSTYKTLNDTLRSVHFAQRVSLVSGDEGNYQITIIHKEAAERLYAQGKVSIPGGYRRIRNVAKLYVTDHHPKMEIEIAGSRKRNSSKTTFLEHFVVTPGSDSPRFIRAGQSIMGVVHTHKPISDKTRDLYGVRQVG